jgi:cyanosortase A-associated protein
MSLKWNEKVRPVILVLLSFMAVGVLGWTLVAPKPLTLPKAEYHFTAQFAPPGWVLSPARELPPSSAEYQCFKEDVPVTVQLRYTDDLRVEHTPSPDLTDAFLSWDAVPLDIQTCFLLDLRVKIRVNAKTVSRQLSKQTVAIASRDGVGSGSRWSDGNAVHFSSIICPTGEGVALRPQFSRNLYVKQLRLSHIWRSRFANGFPVDSRAITLDVFVPEKALSPEKASEILEQAGFEWMRWCSAHFPQ